MDSHPGIIRTLHQCQGFLTIFTEGVRFARQVVVADLGVAPDFSALHQLIQRKFHFGIKPRRHGPSCEIQ